MGHDGFRSFVAGGMVGASRGRLVRRQMGGGLEG